MATMMLALALLTSACADDGPTALAGVVREPPPDVSTVVLPDVANGGEDFATVATPGNLLLVYFGYTSCPDVCPATLAQLRNAVQDLDVADRVEVAMITVDPIRDVPEALTGYLHTFFPEGHSLRTMDADRLVAAAEPYGAGFELTINEEGEVVDVAHTAFLYAVDSSGRILVQWPFGTTTPDLQNDLSYLFEQGV